VTLPASSPPGRLSADNARRLRATVLGLAITVILLAGGLGHALRESWLRHGEADQQRIVDVTASASASLQRRLDAVDRALVDLAALAGDALASGAVGAWDGMHGRLQELSRANPDADRFGIRDAEGQVVASSEPLMRRAPPVAGAEFFEAHRSGGSTGLVISRPFAQANSGIRIVVLSRAVRTIDGRLLGVVAATLPTAALLDDVAGLRHLPTQLALVRGDGAVLQWRGWAADTAGETIPVGLLPVLDRAPAGNHGAEVALDGRAGQVAWQALGTYPLRIVASVARDDLVDDFLRQVRLSFLVAGSILLMVGALAIWLTAMMRSHLLRLEAESRSLEARFRDGIESMADGVLLFDGEDRLIAWNRRFAEMIPHRPEHLAIGARARDLVASGHWVIRPGDDPAIVEAAVEARMRARRALEGTELRTLKGRVIEVTDRRTSDGGLVSIFRDVTDERRLIEQLSLSEGRFRDFASTSSDWFWETDAEHRITYASHGIRALGLSTSSAVGGFFVDLGAKVGRCVFTAETGARLAAQLERQESFRDLELALATEGGGVIELAGKPIFDSAQRFAGFRGMGRDVTESVRQRAEVARALISEREANAQHRRFISIASHEFRTPLAVIDSATQRVVATLPSDLPPEIGRRLLRIRGAVARMTQIIDRTLATARLDEGRIEFRPEVFDLAALLRELCERQRSITPEFEIACDFPPHFHLEADPRLADQIFTNLLSNAVKYSGAARRIELTLMADDRICSVAVRDHGVGIDADDVAQLFQRFFRARSANGVPGTGIGLHLVRELVRMHGGEVDVRSRIGEGSVFDVRLPRRAQPPLVEAA
jgi:signal transduction histidine kinase